MDFGRAGNPPFSDVMIGSNQHLIQGVPNTCFAIQYDDIAFANTDYTGFVDDGNGNDRIGMLTTTAEIVAPTNLQSNK